MKTLYDVLGVQANATHSQIEHGYRVSLEAYIDSQGPGQTEESVRRMRNIRDAYLLLSSPAKRRAYDKRLRKYQAWQGAKASRNLRMRQILIAFASLTLLAGLLGMWRYLPHH